MSIKCIGETLKSKSLSSSGTIDSSQAVDIYFQQVGETREDGENLIDLFLEVFGGRNCRTPLVELGLHKVARFPCQSDSASLKNVVARTQ